MTDHVVAMETKTLSHAKFVLQGSRIILAGDLATINWTAAQTVTA